jgi:MraZ protein
MGAQEAVFLGEYQHTLDAKGRVSLPRKFRDEIGARLVVSKGLERCLYVYAADGYRAFLDNLLSASDFDRNSRAVRRHFTAGASEVDIDGAGRVAVTPALREFAGLTKEIVVAGVADHLEIWDAAAWTAYESANAPTIEDAAEELSRSGIL